MIGETEILLFAADKSVQRVVSEVAGEIGSARVETADQIDHAAEHLGRGRVSVLLTCIDDRQDEARVALLLETAAELGLRVPSIALSREDDVERNCRLLSMGMLECMSLPIDTSRLAMLLEVFTIKPHEDAEPKVVKVNGHNGNRHKGNGNGNGNGNGARARLLPTKIDGFLLESDALESLMRQLQRVAPLDTTILITGETGTGKTHLARVIHELSPRKEKPFVVVPCGAVPPSLLESEMFGHVRGAFTHADRDRTGKFLHVGDGTLLLDEVDCVPLEGQMKLLRVVEERTFEPVGANKTHQMRARLIVATNRPLQEEVDAGRFRADLFYRLKVVEFTVPPLRERPESIKALAEKFLEDARANTGRSVTQISTDAMRAMEAYRWPGNVRELRNVIERAVALGQGGAIEVSDLPECIGANGTTFTPFSLAASGVGNVLASARSHAERARLIRALDRNDNNRTTTAVELGISRVTLYKKLHKHGLA